MELSQEYHGVLRRLAARFDVAGSADEKAAATSQAIADTTDSDLRDINRNFDYDFEAYRGVNRPSQGSYHQNGHNHPYALQEARENE